MSLEMLKIVEIPVAVKYGLTQKFISKPLILLLIYEILPRSRRKLLLMA